MSFTVTLRVHLPLGFVKIVDFFYFFKTQLEGAKGKIKKIDYKGSKFLAIASRQVHSISLKYFWYRKRFFEMFLFLKHEVMMK